MSRRTPSFISVSVLGLGEVEDGPMHLLRRVAAGTADHDFVTLVVPLQYRTRTDAQLPANPGGNRDLALRGEP